MRLLGVGGLIGLLAVGVGGAWWLSKNAPFSSDDGPFHGEPRDDCAQLKRSPSQRFEVRFGALESYDPKKAGEAPTVLLRRKDKTIAWCVFAVAYPQTQVDSVRFSRVEEPTFGGPRVRGRVEWTYGAERSVWMLDRSGGLEEYWYSW